MLVFLAGGGRGKPIEGLPGCGRGGHRCGDILTLLVRIGILGLRFRIVLRRAV